MTPVPDSYSARSAAPLEPIRKARVDIALKVIEHTVADLKVEARMKRQVDPDSEIAEALVARAERYERTISDLKVEAPEADEKSR